MSNIIVVTGASSGVGLEIVKRFVERKWSVIGLARSKDKLESLKNTIEGKYGYYVVDIRGYTQVSKVFNEIYKQYGKIDILVNNASVFKQEKFIECDVNDINDIIDTNLKGTMFCTREAIKLMKGNGGRIINIASVAATHGIINQAIYCASKYGVDGFAEALNQESIEEGILISTIYPGGTDTPLWDEENNPYLGDLSKVLKPEDIVNMVEYIANLPKRVVLKKVVIFPSNEWH